MQISFSRHLIQLSINSASKSRGFHGICRKSFLPRQVCFANLCGLVGERFSPTPPFFTLGGECRVIWFFPSGSRRRLCRLTCPPPAANSSSRFALRQRAFAALRSPASHLLLAPLLGAKEFVHIRSAAHTALVVPGGNVAWDSLPRATFRTAAVYGGRTWI